MGPRNPPRRPRSGGDSAVGSLAHRFRFRFRTTSERYRHEIQAEPVPGAWRREHRPALDGLRGLAVLGVLAFHDRRLEGGWLGVDLFFTLSGFLITSLLVAEVHQSARVDLWAFWRRRARRLLPAFVALVVVLVGWAQLSSTTPWASSDLRGASFASLAYVANWYQVVAPGGYWDLFGATPSPLLHAWSLAIEEQFYLVFPLVVWWCVRTSRRPVRFLASVCSLGLVTSFTATIVFGFTTNLNRVYLGTDTRMGSVLVGALLACILALRPLEASPAVSDEVEGDEPETERGPIAIPPWLVSTVGLAAMLVLGWLWGVADGQGRFVLRGGLTFHALLVAVLIAVVVSFPTSIPARVFGFGPLVLLGTISYGLYLWHWPVFLYVDQRLNLDPLPSTAVKLAASLSLAAVSLVLLERPIRTRGLSFLGGVVPTVAVGAVVVLAVALVPAPRLGGTRDALANAPRSASQLGALPPVTADTGSAPVPTVSVPSEPVLDVPAVETATQAPLARSVLDRPGRVPGATRLMIVGDSVPFLLGEALAGKQEEFGLVVANRALPSCSAAAPDRERSGNRKLPDPPDCAAIWAEDAAAFDPDIVVVSLNGDAGVELRYDGTWVTPCSDIYARRMSARLSAKIAPFVDRGALVVMLTPLPGEIPDFRPTGQYEAIQCMIAMERDVASATDGAVLVDFGSWICPTPDERCRQSLGGQSISRSDFVHFVDDGALAVWRSLIPAIADLAKLT